MKSFRTLIILVRRLWKKDMPCVQMCQALHFNHPSCMGVGFRTFSRVMPIQLSIDPLLKKDTKCVLLKEDTKYVPGTDAPRISQDQAAELYPQPIRVS
jgi:hypothetical protein